MKAKNMAIFFVIVVLFLANITGCGDSITNEDGNSSDSATIVIYPAYSNDPYRAVTVGAYGNARIFVADDTVGAPLFLHIRRDGYYTDFMECSNGDTVILNNNPVPTVPGMLCGRAFCEFGPLFDSCHITRPATQTLYAINRNRDTLLIQLDTLGRFAVNHPNDFYSTLFYGSRPAPGPITIPGLERPYRMGWFSAPAHLLEVDYYDLFF